MVTRCYTLHCGENHQRGNQKKDDFFFFRFIRERERERERDGLLFLACTRRKLRNCTKGDKRLGVVLYVFILFIFFMCKVSIQFSNQIVEEEFDYLKLIIVDKEEGVLEDDGLAIEKKT
jgi:hypothetical protein